MCPCPHPLGHNLNFTVFPVLCFCLLKDGHCLIGFLLAILGFPFCFSRKRKLEKMEHLFPFEFISSCLEIEQNGSKTHLDLVWPWASKGIDLCSMVSCRNTAKQASWQVDHLEREQRLHWAIKPRKRAGCPFLEGNLKLFKPHPDTQEIDGL